MCLTWMLATSLFRGIIPATFVYIEVTSFTKSAAFLIRCCNRFSKQLEACCFEKRTTSIPNAENIYRRRAKSAFTQIWRQRRLVFSHFGCCGTELRRRMPFLHTAGKSNSQKENQRASAYRACAHPGLDAYGYAALSPKKASRCGYTITAS